MDSNEAIARCELKAIEEQYWQAFEHGQIEECLAPVHDTFLGCDSDGKSLAEDDLRTHIRNIADAIREDPKKAHEPTISIVDKPIFVGDVAIILLTRRGGKKLVTHTWIRHQESWVLIGGMSTTLEGYRLSELERLWRIRNYRKLAMSPGEPNGRLREARFIMQARIALETRRLGIIMAIATIVMMLATIVMAIDAL